jgi:uncharacterized protein (TIGR02452 family)
MKTLILGAFGCGGYKNDPHKVALLFSDACKKYSHYFDHICFAIYDGKKRKPEPYRNYEIFKSVFEKENLLT